MSEPTTAKHNLYRTLEHLEQALADIQTAQLCDEANPIRLETWRLEARDLRGKLLDILEESYP